MSKLSNPFFTQVESLFFITVFLQANIIWYCSSFSIQKRIIRAFKFLGFKIEISTNIRIVNFLDVTLDLSNNSYKPFIKTNQNPSYINVNSNHPKNIIKQIPKAVNLRIGKLSANEKIFKESSKRYIDALKIVVLRRILDI